MDRAGMASLGTSVADKRTRFDPCAVLLFKSRTDAITFVTEPACSIADDQLVTGVLLLATISMDAEVIGVIETPSVPGVDPSVPKDLL